MRSSLHCLWIVAGVALSTSSPCSAQCTQWDASFSTNGLTHAVPMPHSAQAFAMLEFDDGSGPAVFVGGNFTLAGGTDAHNIAKWDGTSWAALGSGTECAPGTPFCENEQYGAVRCLIGFDDGRWHVRRATRTSVRFPAGCAGSVPSASGSRRCGGQGNNERKSSKVTAHRSSSHFTGVGNSNLLPK